MQSHMLINNLDLVVLIQIWQGNAEVIFWGWSRLSSCNTYMRTKYEEHLKYVKIFDLYILQNSKNAIVANI